MKKVQKPSVDVGVLVGRFQVHELHAAHLDLIQSVCSEHGKVVIFLGLSPLMVTQNNPLDYESRKQMIQEKFPNVIILYVNDCFSDEVWSEALDAQLKPVLNPGQTAILYGSRDSFISHYHGKHPTQELIQEVYVSGSESRKTISKKVKASPDFRAGVIWAAYNQYPKCYPTVDIAIFNEDYTKLLMARKPKEDKYRFVGGFADPKSENYEADARREVAEETGIETSEMEYIGSAKIPDWRYRSEVDCIKTLFFRTKYVFGAVRANDDIVEARWFEWDKLTKNQLVETHHILFDMLAKKMHP